MFSPSNTATDERSDAIELSTSDRHRLLAADRRRLALEVLTGTSGTVSLEELTREVAAREDDRGVQDEASVDRSEIEISLHHHHLPKMAEMHVLEYDPETNVIRPSWVSLDDVRPGDADLE
ncbi:DUF7344 domain-containing protein [Natronosalvus halobius]|uniref:DUF7344 domain-containing protein n=1 Tax=Natronosalvus halobius TaxID=2953746 RepID=UPI00209F9BD5|nr:hypothetical protein [Natronosalvus halobius]USZ70256.1 hypothetical protein NGM15_08965 [Natronosalvus halobius]